MRKKLKFKKLLNEYRTHFYELQYIKDVLKEWLPEFEIYYRQYCAQNNIDLKTLNSNNTTRLKQIFSTTESLLKPKPKDSRREEFNSKDIFRQIARRFHPDSVGADHPQAKEYEEIFKKATQAIEMGNWGDLFDIADTYDLDLKDYDSISETLKLSIKRTKKEIESQKTTYAWLLFNCENNEECMQNVVKQFLNHLFNI